jgi:peptidoglycan hydrolase-like protein with peptidoglycan-binding domain
MTSFSGRSSRASARGTRLGVAGLVTVALLLCLPAPGFAHNREAQTERGESFATALSSAGLLSRGAGYGTPGGSKLVRGLQARLRNLGHEPGPVDGLLGPLTEGAVLRFQRARGLAVDGVVGPQTKASLVGRRVELPGPTSKPRDKRQPADTSEPKPSVGPSPLPSPLANPGPSTESPRSAAPSPAPKPPVAGEPSEGIAPAYAALLGGLVVGLLLLAFRVATTRQARRPSPKGPTRSPAAGTSRLNVGVACAALLGVLAAGAAGGAAFATRAAPDAPDSTAPDRGVTTVDPLGTGSAAAARHPQSQRPPPRSGKAGPRRSTRPSRTPHSARETAQAAEDRVSAAPAIPVTPPPWPIAAQQRSPSTSEQAPLRRVARITPLNRDRIAPGDPDVVVAGEQVRPR